MLDNKILRNPNALAEVTARLLTKGFELNVALLSEIDEKRRVAQQHEDDARAKKKSLSASIGERIRNGASPDEAKAAVHTELIECDTVIDGAHHTREEAEQQLAEYSLTIPNVPLETVPVGNDESDNVVVRSWGEKPTFDFDAKPHWELGEDLGLLSAERGSALSGARFMVYRGLGARLERSLAQFMLNTHTAAGYEEIIPPYLVTTDTITGTGQLPKFAHDQFKIENSDLWMIPTAEVPVTNLAKDTIFAYTDLPQRMVAFTPCFRAEAGAAGRDTRGIIRQHQFHKVELVHLATGEDGEAQLDQLTAQAEGILQALNLHYRVVELCTGDLGFGAAKTYDLEVWCPGQGRYLEISSCSLMGDFQAKRMRARYKDSDGNNHPITTLNGSGLAVGRCWVAVTENYQQADGTIAVPDQLKPYMGCDILNGPN